MSKCSLHAFHIAIFSQPSCFRFQDSGAFHQGQAEEQILRQHLAVTSPSITNTTARRWAKHGTCISTLDTDCYTSYTPQQEVVDFFTRTVALFKALPSYTWLSTAGITPSSTKTYTLAQILAALKTPRGVSAVVQCENTNQLDEIWYFYDVKGSVQSGTFVAVNPSTSPSFPLPLHLFSNTPITPPFFTLH